MARIVTGALHAANRMAIDWSASGLVAYGAQSYVVVVHADSVVVVQTLVGHKAAVCKVRWCPFNYTGGSQGERRDRLASADALGQLIVWQTTSGSQHSTFGESARPVADMQWLRYQEALKDLLLVLHPPYALVLWNAHTGEKIWKKSYTDVLNSFSVDPFDPANVAFLTQSGNLLLVDDLCANRAPSSNGQLYRIASLQTSSSAADVAALAAESERRSTTATLGAKFIKRQLQLIRNLNAAETVANGAPTEEPCPCLQITYHPAVRNALLVVYAREAMILDTDALQTTAHVVLDRHASPFCQVFACAQRDAIYFLQENACLTLRVQRFRTAGRTPMEATEITRPADMIDFYNPAEIVYESVCASEGVRVTKAYGVSSAAVSAASERHVCVLMSTGRLLFYQLASATAQSADQLCRLAHVLDAPTDVAPTVAPPLRLVLSGTLSGLGGAPTVVRARPLARAVAADDPYEALHLVAVATVDGCVQLVDEQSATVERDFAVHSCAVRCMEWQDERHVVTCAHSQTLSTSASVRNELFKTDIYTGLSKVVRPDSDESPIELIRVSHYNSYLALTFRDQPMEVWDLKSLRLLRRMSRSCPIIVDLAWSGKQRSTRSNKPSVVVNTDAANADKGSAGVYRENLVVLDTDCHLYHIVVKGMHVRDGREVNTQWATASPVNAMAWKDDYLAFGGGDGRLSVWDLERKQSRASSIQRGAVRQLRFATQPEDHTLVVLHADGVAVWSTAKLVPLQQLFVPRDLPATPVSVDLSGDATRALVVGADGALLSGGATRLVTPAAVAPSVLAKCFCPMLLSGAGLHAIGTVLRDQTVTGKMLDEEQPTAAKAKLTEVLVGALTKCAADADSETLRRHMDSLDETALAEVLNAPSIAERVARTALLVGDDWELALWTVFEHFIKSADDGDCDDRPLLDNRLDLLWSRQRYSALLCARCACFDSRRASAAQAAAHVAQLVALGRRDTAVQLLLSTDSERSEYYSDCLLACLLASPDSPGDTHTGTIKLIATSLIASGRLSEGVQLLCFIDKTVDACRYLQSCGHWQRSASLAKATLDDSDWVDIVRKWADHLLSAQVGQKTWALMLLASARQWARVLEVLLTLRRAETAALLLCSLDAAGVPTDDFGADRRELVFCEYARQLQDAGFTTAALAYCDRGGELGVSIRKEIALLS